MAEPAAPLPAVLLDTRQDIYSSHIFLPNGAVKVGNLANQLVSSQKVRYLSNFCGACRKALRTQAQGLAQQPFSREAYARDPKQARRRFPRVHARLAGVYRVFCPRPGSLSHAGKAAEVEELEYCADS